MKIILLQDVKGVGRRFEEKNVSDGYANNFLLPKNLALPANSASAKRIEQLKTQADAKREAEEKEIKEKEAQREAKHLELEKFRQSQREGHSQSSSS